MTDSAFDYRDIYYASHDADGEAFQRDVEAKFGYINMHGLCPDDRKSRILDIGSANGATLVALRKMGCDHAVGIELFRALADESRAKHGLDVVCSDALDYLRNERGKFDVILAFDVLEHIAKERQIEFLKLVFSHLSDHGYAAFSVPNALNPCFSWIRYGDWTHQCAFTDLSLGFLLKTAGFKSFHIGNNHPDTDEVRSMKRPFYDMLKIEHHFDEPILTPNLFAVAFVDEADLRRHLEKAPPFKADYSVPPPWSAAQQQLRAETDRLREELAQTRSALDALRAELEGMKNRSVLRRLRRLLAGKGGER